MPKKAYQAPTITPVGSLHQLTQIINKNNNNTPDGYAYHGVTLTS